MKIRTLFLLTMVCLGLALLPAPPARAQLQTLSRGNPDLQWREAQLQAFDQQLSDANLPEELQRELAAQKQWLAAWKPGQAPAAQPPASDAAAAKRLTEPALDPNERATELRERLFNEQQRPTVKDTTALQKALTEHPDDPGLRQLQLHWLDQPRYRDDYWKEIADAGGRVAALLGKLPPTAESKTASAFAIYRKARALAHCLAGRPELRKEIAGAAQLSAEDRQQMHSTLGQCERQIEELVGSGHDEFFALELYVLRQEGWKGRALELLEEHAGQLDPHAYWKTKQELLSSLGWSKPAAEAAAKVAALTPARDAPRLEFEFVPPTEPK
ncbi:MAG: hypothetical protein ACTHOU_15510 [Aureliella sp.]